MARRHREQRAQEEAQRASFRATLQQRLRFVGSDSVPGAASFLGWVDDDPDQPASLSRDGGKVILASGVQGSGKTVFSTVLVEGGQGEGPPLTSGRALPTASILFHVEEHERLPQILDGLAENPVARDLELLQARLGVGGAGLRRLRLATLPSMLPELGPRLLPYQDLGLEVVPIRLPLSQLGQAGLEGALGADSGARFVQRMLEDAADQGRDLTVARMRRFIDGAEDLNAAMKRAAHLRLGLLQEIESAPEGGPDLWSLAGPGVTTVLYLGGPHLCRSRVAPLLVGLLNGLLLPSALHGPFQRVITVDEMNLIAEDPAAMRAFVRTGRVARHRGVILVLLGQDLLCVPDELFGLAETCAVFQQRNPRCLEHLRDRFGALRGVRWEQVERLTPGEALLATTHSTDPGWRQGVRRVRLRPPCCRHGGFTRAVV